MAAMIPEATVEQVLQQVNIADYIGQTVQLHKAGQNLFGLCPFHEENTPSFSVSESKQIFHCFSCGRGGNVYKFVMELDHLSFPEAVAKVAEFANVPLDVHIDSAPREAPEVTAQKQILRDVTDLYHHVLVNTQNGEEALNYLLKRGLTQETIDAFEIGFAPAEKNLLQPFLKNREIDYQAQRETGLFVENQNGELFDRFKDRIMFPLKDQNGAVIGFSGRILHQSDQAKYLNSPETGLFNKRDVLFNMNTAKDLFNKDTGAILFEGFMDVIAAYQAGVKTGIASMGTSLTNEQVQQISRHTKKLTICYDGDAAGINATHRAVDLVGNNPRLKTSVVLLPDGQDPDEFIKANGAEAFQSQLKKELTPTAFLLHYLSMDVDLSQDQAKIDYLNQALALVAKEAPIAQSVYLQQLTETTGIPVQTLANQLPKPVQQHQTTTMAPPPVVTSSVKFNRYQKAQRQLLNYSFHDDLVATKLVLSAFVFPDDQYQAIFTAWTHYLHEGHAPNVAAFTDSLEGGLANVAADVAMMTLPESSDEAIDNLMALLATTPLHDQLDQIKQELNQAQRIGDNKRASELMAQYYQLMRQLKG